MTADGVLIQYRLQSSNDVGQVILIDGERERVFFCGVLGSDLDTGLDSADRITRFERSCEIGAGGAESGDSSGLLVECLAFAQEFRDIAEMEKRSLRLHDRSGVAALRADPQPVSVRVVLRISKLSPANPDLEQGHHEIGIAFHHTRTANPALSARGRVPSMLFPAPCEAVDVLIDPAPGHD